MPQEEMVDPVVHPHLEFLQHQILAMVEPVEIQVVVLVAPVSLSSAIHCKPITSFVINPSS
jgi:hypothetical protein